METTASQEATNVEPNTNAKRIRVVELFTFAKVTFR